MSLKSILAALGRLFHRSPQPDTTVADNAKITALTGQLNAALAQITQAKAVNAGLTQDLATSRTNEAAALSAANDAHAAQTAAEAALATANTAIATLTAQLDALPDQTALAANEDVQDKIVAAAAELGQTPAAG